MPLKLVIGPANSAKARVVLDAYRAHGAREPLLVVPTLADVDRYRRELSPDGAVFGAGVVRFAWLVDEMARRAGVAGRPVAGVARERIAAAAVARTRLRTLGAAARTRGFVTALLGLVDELEEGRIDPARWRVALRAWARGDDGGTAAERGARTAFAEDVASLYSSYRKLLSTLGRDDARLFTAAALDALRLAPSRWGATPVFVYGFDDFGRLQLDAIETLAVHCRAEVTVSLPYEAGRQTFAGSASTYAELEQLAATTEACEPRAEYYAKRSRAALHHLERHLFGAAPPPEGQAADAGPERLAAGDAILLLEGGGWRAELELVGAHVVSLLRDGVPAEEITVVLREPARHSALVAQVFGAYGIPYALERRIAAGHTAVGRGLLALARCALLPAEADADDVLTWLRSPGLLRIPALADGLEADLRRRGIRGAAQARAAWEERHWPLDAIDRLAAAHARGPAELYEALRAQATAILAAPFARRAHVLSDAERDDARATRALLQALGDLAVLAATDPELAPPADELLHVLGEVPVLLGDPPRPGAITVADPLGIRARRVRAVFVCGLQEGEFPRPAAPEPFLGDAERAAINAAAGLRLPLRGDRLARERSLFYAAASRPTELLALSWHASDDDGAPAVRSLFVDDVLDLFAPSGVEVRELGAAGWSGALVPTAREARRAQIAAAADSEEPPPAGAGSIAPLRHSDVLATLRTGQAWSASGLESWVACPVRWFVERFLCVKELVPDPEPVVRGMLAHRVLEEALRTLQAGPAETSPGDGDGGRTAAGPLRPDRLDAARRHAHDALARLADEYPISANPERLRAALRRLEADIVRYLEHAAHAGSTYAPSEFELRFGGPGDPHDPVALGERGLRLRGRIDRVDVSPDGRHALVYDYKGKNATPQAGWEQEGKLQLALYMLALPALLGLEAVGGLYQPLGARKLTARGLLRANADPGLDAVANDRVDAARFSEALDQALAAAEQAVEEIRAGELVPRPATCGWKGGGCAYPSICRCSWS